MVTFLLAPATNARSPPQYDREARQLLLDPYTWYGGIYVEPFASSYSTPTFKIQTRQAHETENSKIQASLSKITIDIITST